VSPLSQAIPIRIGIDIYTEKSRKPDIQIELYKRFYNAKIYALIEINHLLLPNFELPETQRTSLKDRPKNGAKSRAKSLIGSKNSISLEAKAGSRANARLLASLKPYLDIFSDDNAKRLAPHRDIDLLIGL